MAQFIAKKVGRNLIGKQVASLEPNDPHYEQYVDDRGVTRSRKRTMPVGLTKKEERILKSVRRRAHYLDKGFRLPCCGDFRFGWTFLFGLIPLLGDIVNAILNYGLVLRKCRQADLPAGLQSKMVFNNVVSIGVGMVPIAGDIVVAAWKCNSRNAALLEAFLIKRAEARNKALLKTTTPSASATGTPTGSTTKLSTGKTSTSKPKPPTGQLTQKQEDAIAEAVMHDVEISTATGEIKTR